MNYSSAEDHRLLFKCLSGDRTASETLVRRFSELVYGSVQYTLMAKDVSFNRQDLEDLHNTVFLRLFEQGCKKLRQYQGKNGCSLASWIRVIAVRTVLDHLRKNGVDAMVWQKKRIPLEELPELKADDIEFKAQYEKAEQGRLLRVGVQRLPPRDRLFMKLHFDHGLSAAEVAEAMQLSIGNVYTIKHRVIQRLKSHVASAMNNSP
ncbi:MAG: sigma-70 family RNA polymerase sigma factor [Deltaproteobacteria bacterium]|nr:sigma-70 family RNA polymerase sigma factor [Deltaproteobacteria bacterium]